MELSNLPPLIEIESVIEFKTIHSLLIYNFEKGYRSPGETHEPRELIFVDSGEQRVINAGAEYILKKNQMMIHDKNVYHLDSTLSDKATIYIMSFTAESKYFDNIVNKVISLDSEQVAMLKEFYNFCYQNIDKSTNWFYFDRRYQTSEKHTLIGSTQNIKNKIENFFISLFNSENKKFEENNPVFDDPIIAKTLAILDEMKTKPFSLEEISRQTNYSKSYLCRYFKEKTKTTINIYFYYLKIDEAKKMLLDNTLSVEQVAQNLGFDSVQYFSLVFKKYTGSAPTVWRTIYSNKK